MPAPTKPWHERNPHRFTPPALLGQRTIDAGEVCTFTFLALTAFVELENTGDVDLKVGVLDDVDAGVQGDAYRLLPAGECRAWPWATRLLVILNDTETDGALVTGSVTLTATADAVDLTDAGGFEGVESGVACVIAAKAAEE